MTHTEIPTLTTPRLVLRAWQQSDLDGYAAWLSDEETVRYIGGKTMDRADAWRSMATMAGSWLLKGFGFWAVTRKDTGALVGRVGLWFPEGWPGLEVGWLIGREARRQGYAAEAARASIEWGFQTQRVDQLISIIHVDNAASVATARAVGERYLRDEEVRGFPCRIYGIDRP
jgi:RimJ/RimL family protein N-acetyltransferase